MATILGSIYSWKFEDLARSPLLSQSRLKVFQPWMYLSSVTRLHEHRLRYQTLQPHAQKCATHNPRRTKVLCFLPDQFSEKTGRINTPSPLANISSKTHSSPQIRCFHAKHQADPLFLLHDTVGHAGPKKRVTPQRCRNAAARGPKIFRMGRLASCCGLFSERRSHSLTCKNPLWSSKKRPFIPSPPPLITDLFACARHDSPPRRLCAIFTSPASLRTKAKEATDPIWPFKVYHIVKTISKPDEPILDYLHHGPKRGFVCEELLVVPTDTELPPLHRWYSIGSVWMPSWQDPSFVVVGVQR